MIKALSIAALAAALLTTDSSAQLPDTIRIEGGLITEPHVAERGVLSFRGIPYAAAPVGSLRWKAPQPIAPWEGARRADAFGPTCMQDPPPPGSFYQLEFFEEIEPMGEDCLFLNVWTAAASAEERRPVMMWIHGGAFRQGSGSMPSFDGTTFAEKGIVLVTINYRLGVFGLMAHPDLTAESPDAASGNYGLLDQVAALQWIRRNIAQFGGDPDNVTLFGQSAGAASVNVLMASPLAAGLFHRAILQSGSSFAFGSEPPLDEAEKTGVSFASALGAESASELRALRADTLHARGRTFSFSPNVDGHLLEDDVQSVFRAGRQAPVPVMTGATADEGSPMYGPTLTAQAYREMAERNYDGDAERYLSLYPARSDEEAGRSFSHAFADRLAWGSHTLASLHEHDDVYVYLFSRVPPGRDSARYRSYHSAELVYVFDALDAVDRPWTGPDRALADRMSSYWAQFAVDGNPNGPDLPAWPRYDPASMEVLELGESIRRTRLLDPAVLQFYDERARSEDDVD